MSYQLPGFVPAPHTTATNAYDLLDDVVRAIEEEPRRLMMDNWIFTPRDLERKGLPAPACGTVGCIGGWIVILTSSSVEDVNQTYVPTQAEELILGERAWRSESPDARQRRHDLNHVFTRFPDMEEPPLIPGTPEYVARVVEAIRAFQSTHETFLRAKSIP